jgi:hypothetical protein
VLQKTASAAHQVKIKIFRETPPLSWKWTNDIAGPKEPAQDEQVLALDVLEAPERDYTPIDKVRGWQDQKKYFLLC